MIRDDGISSSVGTSPFDDPTRQGGVTALPPPVKTKKSKLDSPANRKRLSRLRDWYEQETQRQAANRYQMALDVDYYDSLQWSEEEAQVLLDRGQAPVVYNEIAPTINWMLGTERRTRIDYKVLPRRKEEGDLAEVKTKLLKYLSDVNGEPLSRSRAFASAVKAGMGWLEVGVRGDESDEPIYYRAEDWRYVLYDSQSVEPDLSDARYLFRSKWVDADVAEALFPERVGLIRQAVVDSSSLEEDDADDPWYLGSRVTKPGSDYQRIGKYRPYDAGSLGEVKRDRVKLIEAWYREPGRRETFRSGPLAGETMDPGNPAHQWAVEQGASVHDGLVMQVRVAIYCAAGLLFEGESPYRHGRFPFVPVWAYRRQRDNAPYSPIRVMRDSQDSLNKRGSKALWILSANRVIAEAGAVDDWEQLREEVARPDAIIIKERGKEMIIDRDVQLADQHLRLMDRDALAIRNGGGVTAENLGRETNASSGKAIIARQDQGTVVTSELYDNLRWAVQWAGEIELSLVEQFMTGEKVVRLVGDRGTASFVEINAQDPATGQVVNDVTASKADFVVSQQDYRDTLRLAMFESLFEIVGRLAQMNPAVAMNMLDLVVEMADVPGRDELVARIRQLNGQRDPDSEPTPEEQQQMAQQAAMQQAQQQLAMAQMEATVAKLQAEVDKLRADQEKAQAESINKRLEAMYSALQSAQIVAQAPGAAVMADEIMKGAGFDDPVLKEEQAMIQQAAAQQQQAMQEQAARQQQAMAEQQAAAQAEQQALAGRQGQADPMAGAMMPAEPAPADPSALEGARMGIETPGNDGMRQA
jgi:hypothetical protein